MAIVLYKSNTSHFAYEGNTFLPVFYIHLFKLNTTNVECIMGSVIVQSTFTAVCKYCLYSQITSLYFIFIFLTYLILHVSTLTNTCSSTEMVSPFSSFIFTWLNKVLHVAIIAV